MKLFIKLKLFKNYVKYVFLGFVRSFVLLSYKMFNIKINFLLELLNIYMPRVNPIYGLSVGLVSTELLASAWQCSKPNP